MNQIQTDTQQQTNSVAIPQYFVVSPTKFLVMTFMTFGAYQLYWFYKNWCVVKETQKPDIWPLLRSFFPYFFCYSLFKKMTLSFHEVTACKMIYPGRFAIAWVALNLLFHLQFPMSLFGILSYLLILPIQLSVNEIQKKYYPHEDRNDKYSFFNIVAIVGGVFICVILFGLWTL